MGKSNQIIRRYLTLAKFISLLEYKSLYFTRSDKFADPLDGLYPTEKDPKGQYITETIKAREVKTGQNITLNKIGGQAVRNISHSMRDIIVVNCWVQSPYESEAMWSIYCNQNNGLAIESTVTDLGNSLDYNTNPTPVIKPVKYLDYDKEEPPSNNVFDPYFHKRIAFEHEKELRIVIALLHMKKRAPKHGIFIPVNVNRMIKCIHVAPKAPSWYFKIIQDILKRYGINAGIKQSTLFTK